MRRAVRRALLATVLPLLLSCQPDPGGAPVTPSPSPPPPVTPAAPRAARPQHLVTATVADPQTFNPIVATDAASRAAVHDVFDTLVRLDPRTGAMTPALAASWSLDEAGTMLTLTLRDDVRWHDGQPLTARDVAFTFEAIYSTPVPSPLEAALRPGGKPMTVTAVDAHTVRVRVAQPFAPLLSALAVPIVPEHVLGPALRAGTFARQWGTDIAPQSLIGSGPYRLARYEPGRLIHLVRNPDYWMRDEDGRPLPYLDERTIRILPDHAAATRSFLAGEIDLHMPTADELRPLLAAEAEGRFTVREIGVDPGMLFVVFNRNPARYRQNGADNPRLTWFTDPAFLRALAHGVDKAGLISEALDGFGAPAVSFLSADSAFLNPHLVDYAFDPPRARALLDEGGYVDRDGDGVRDGRSGHPIEFTLVTNAGNPVRDAIARRLQRDWERELQVRVHVDAVPMDAMIDRLQVTYDWDAMLMGFTGSVEPNDAASLLRSSGPLHVWYPNQSRPATDWEAEIDRLLERAAYTLDPEVRRDAYWRIQEILHQRLPMIQLVRPLRYSAATVALENYEPSVWGVYRPERLRFREGG